MLTTHYKILRLLVGTLFVLAAALLFIYRHEINLNAIENWLSAHPTLAPLIFITLYSLVIPLFIPSTMIAFMGGALFGPVWGTLFNQISTVIGASLCFVIARYLSADWLEKKLPDKVKHLKHGVEKEGWRFVVMVRLVPWVSYALLNYTLGLTRIRLGVLIGITAVCIFPRVIAYTYIGHAGRMALEGKEMTLQLVLLIPLIMAVIFLPYFIVRVRSDLKQYLRK